jgi:hypothetical protein
VPIFTQCQPQSKARPAELQGLAAFMAVGLLEKLIFPNILMHPSAPFFSFQHGCSKTHGTKD